MTFKWLFNDIKDRLTSPYWRKKEVILHEREEKEKLSNRRPFKRINEKRVFAYFRQMGVKKVLDVGCGVGNLVRYLESLGFEAYGVTVNPKEVNLAQHPRVSLCDIQSQNIDIAFPGKLFDAIVSFDCLEHLELPLLALRNINRLLKPQGLFIAYIPPARWTECDYHVIVYTPRQFRWLLNLTGFDLEYKEGHHYLSNRGITYYARKKYSDRMVYPGVLR